MGVHRITQWQQISRHYPEGEEPALIFGIDPEDQSKAAVWEEGHEPVPLTSPVDVLWLRSPHGEPRVMFLGTVDDGVARVLFDTPPPLGYKDYQAHVVREHLWPYHPIWLFGQIPFRPGEVIVRRQTEGGTGWRTVREERAAGGVGLHRGEVLGSRAVKPA
jgi:hypothetical protein